MQRTNHRDNYQRKMWAMDGEFAPIEETSDRSPSKAQDDEHRWIIGFALFLLGGILLVQYLVGWRIDRWWFILLIIPSGGAFATAWRRYHALGKKQKSAVVRPVVIGLFFLLAA
ncbi:MAG: hypothetical protein A2Z14_06120 [Chloroflexi bacterium RBG_16_48_8]|nr:MAG: hypothetical protein A2Z14_06120 [Chloroflexi bacterium RBG_16_48_8]